MSIGFELDQRIFDKSMELIVFLFLRFRLHTMQRKPAANDSPSSLGESCSNNRSSSSVKILSNISLPPYRPSISSQNSSHNTQLTSQGNLQAAAAVFDKPKWTIKNFDLNQANNLRPIAIERWTSFLHRITLSQLKWNLNLNRNVSENRTSPPKCFDWSKPTVSTKNRLYAFHYALMYDRYILWVTSLSQG